MQTGIMVHQNLPDSVWIKGLSVFVTPMTTSETVRLILARVDDGETLLLGNLNLHGVYMYHTNRDFARYCLECGVVLIDGAPLAKAAKVPMSKRIGSTDWLDELLPQAAGLRILAVGGTPESSKAAESHFRQKFPAVQWTGVDGYSCQEPSSQLMRQIEESDIVLVGMGMPLQEKWIMRNEKLLEGKVVANVGGCFDYYAGSQRLAPRWMGRAGIEWLYRLAVSPVRLSHRYLIEPLKLAAILARRMVHA